jgi:L-amino acid N-acyltransferase YncA
MLNPASLREEDIQEVFGYYHDLVDRKIRYFSITDARGASEVPSAQTRKAIGQAAAKLEARSEGYALGTAVVIESRVIRGALTAIQWVAQPRHPMRYCGTMQEAVDYAIGELERNGVEITPAIRTYRRSLDAIRAPSSRA